MRVRGDEPRRDDRPTGIEHLFCGCAGVVRGRRARTDPADPPVRIDLIPEVCRDRPMSTRVRMSVSHESQIVPGDQWCSSDFV
ncbi:hypothetical protein GCM10009608_53550 [Pseudonocardia alaniniphila]